MTRWKWCPDGHNAVCACGNEMRDMKLRMVYDHSLGAVELMPTKVVYAGDGAYELKTELRCPCGKVYKEDIDYQIGWTESDYGWIWTLGVEMEAPRE